jgi:two-component system LytT family response regulator
MPIEDGFDLLNHYPNRNFQTIFVTAHDEFAIKALRTGATDYILKPILTSELTTAIDSVKRIIAPPNTNNTNKITLHYEGGKSIVNTQEIVYIKGIDNLAVVYQTQNRKVMVSKTLKHFEETLHNDFFRIHKSFLVNLTYASKILSRQATFLELLDGTKLPISRRNYKSLQSALNVC